MTRAFQLFRLQQVDTQIDRSNQRLAEISELLAENSALLQAQGARDAADERLEQALKALKSAEDQTRAQRIKIEQNENHLYSGRVSAPKELQDLQQEVAALKRHLDTLEERQLIAILAFEEVEAEQQAFQKQLDAVWALKMEADAGLSGERTKLLADVESLQSERNAANAAIPEADRNLYEGLRKRRKGVAVADAATRSCGACGTSLSSTLYQAARTSGAITFCDTCGRILYVG